MAQSHAPDDTAASVDPVQKPNNWEIVVSCAYLRLTGATQEAAALAAGGSERQLREWERCSWWPDAEREAQQRWLRGIDSRARVALERAFENPNESATTARWWADRRVSELAPPKVRQDVRVGGLSDLIREAREREGGDK